MKPQEAAKRFEERFVKGLSEKATNADFEKIGELLRSLKRKELADACLKRYLEIYAKHENPKTQSRSDATFYLLLHRVLDLSNAEQVEGLHDILTSQMGPFTPLQERFHALGQTDPADRDKILTIAKQPKEARKEVASVLVELKDAFRRTKNRDPKGLDDLLGFDPYPNTVMLRTYHEQLAALRSAYSACASSFKKETIEGLTKAVTELWEFVKEQRSDGLRLFQLLRTWRTENAKTSFYTDDIAYVMLAGGLLGYALANKAYTQNIRLKAFTKEEMELVMAGFGRQPGPEYVSTYRYLLKRYFDQASSFPQKCDTFLRLLCFAASKSVYLPTDEELKKVVDAIQQTPQEELKARTYRIEAAPGRRAVATGTYKIGTKIPPKVRIVYFEGDNPHFFYCEIDGVPGVAFKVPWSTLHKFAENAAIDLVILETQHLVKFIEFLFQIILAVPLVAEAGIYGLVEAALTPVVTEGVEETLKAFGVDERWALPIMIVASAGRGKIGLGTPTGPPINTLADIERKTIGYAKTELDAARALATDGRAIASTATQAESALVREADLAVARATDTPALAVAEQGTLAKAVESTARVEAPLGASAARAAEAGVSPTLGNAMKAAEAIDPQAAAKALKAAEAVDAKRLAKAMKAAEADTQTLAKAVKGVEAEAQTLEKSAAQAEAASAKGAAKGTPFLKGKGKTEGALESAETRAEPVSSKGKGSSTAKKKGGGDADDIETAKGGKQARGTGEPGTQAKGTPPPPPPPKPPLQESPQGYLSINVEHSKPFQELLDQGWTLKKIPLASKKQRLWVNWQKNVSGVSHEWELSAPSGIGAKLDGLALQSRDAAGLRILEAKAGYTDIVEQSGHFRFSDSKVEQLARQVTLSLESNGRITGVDVVCNKVAVAETYANIGAQQVAMELKNSFKDQLKAFWKGSGKAKGARLTDAEIDRIVEDRLNVEWTDWGKKRP